MDYTYVDYGKKEIDSLLEDGAFYARNIQKYIAAIPPQNSCHSPILEQEVNDLRFYLMHTSPVPHASSSARWVLTAPSSHSATLW